MKFLLLLLLFTATAFGAANVQLQGAFSGQKGSSPQFDYAKLDSVTNAITTIDYAHHEVHSGSSYIMVISDADLDTAEVLSLCFKTPNTTKWIHALIAVGTTVASTVSLNENPTVTVNTGTAVAAINRNRNSTNTSGILNFATVPAVGATRNGTITAPGTVLASVATSGTKRAQIASQADHNDEFILKQNEEYCISVTSLEDNNVPDIKMEWYEHTSVSR